MDSSLSMARISVLSPLTSFCSGCFCIYCVSFCDLEMVFNQAFESFFTFRNSQSLFLCTFIPYIFFSFSVLEFLESSWGPFFSAHSSAPLFKIRVPLLKPSVLWLYPFCSSVNPIISHIISHLVVITDFPL